MDINKLEKKYATSADGMSICYVEHFHSVKTQKLAIFFHGFSSSKNNKTNQQLCPLFYGHGYSLVFFDFRGCGDSSGKIYDTSITNGLKDFIAVNDKLKESGIITNKSHIAFTASSFGAPVCLAASKILRPKLIFLKAPMLNIYRAQKISKGAKKLKQWEKDGCINIPNRHGGNDLSFEYVADSCKYNFFSLEYYFPNAKIHIVHGSSDKISPYEISLNYAKKFSANTELTTIEEGDHHLSKEKDFQRMVRSCGEFIGKNQ